MSPSKGLLGKDTALAPACAGWAMVEASVARPYRGCCLRAAGEGRGIAGARMRNTAVGTMPREEQSCPQHGARGGGSSQAPAAQCCWFKTIQPYGTAAPCVPCPPSSWCVAFAGRFCSAASLQIYKPSQSKDGFAAVSVSWIVCLDRGTAGNPTESFLFFPRWPR